MTGFTANSTTVKSAQRPSKCPTFTNSRQRLASAAGSTAAFALMLASQPQQAMAQAAPTPNLVSACSGVSLPPSVVTGIMTPVVNGIVSPIENTVNPILGVLSLSLPLLPPLSIDTTTLLGNAAAGDPITLQVLNADGVVVGPADQCDLEADSFQLATPRGIAIGGNRITGLGATGQEATAGEINSIAFGNRASTDATAANAIAIGPDALIDENAAGSVALGSGASVTAANSVAIGAGSTATRGALTGYTAIGLAGTQNSVGEVSIGAPGAPRQLTNVAAGTAPTDAANIAQLTGVAAQVGALGDLAVVYDTTDKERVTLLGADGTVIDNVADGTVDAGSREAVNGSQLFATNTNVTNLGNSITTLTTNITNGAIGPVQYSNPLSPTVPNGGTPTNSLTLVGAAPGPVSLHNVADGAVVAGSTDAVNGGQLAAVSAQIGAVDANAVKYDDSSHSTITLDGAGGTRVTNLTAGTLSETSTDAVNGAQLYATNQAVSDNTTAITNLTNTINNGSAGPVQYSNPGTPTTPNGGTKTNDLTLVGADEGPVGLHNVADGVIAAGSTDAVNGGQVYALAEAAVNAVTYDTDGSGNRTNSVTLSGGNPAAPVTINNVAAGTVAAGSTQAVNGGQLYQTNQSVAAAQTTADDALALGQNSVQYSSSRSTVIFNPGGSATTLSNVNAGVAANDAVNVSQLNSAINTAITQANNYTDIRFQAVDYDLREVRRQGYAGTAGALAAAGLPQAYEEGKGMIAVAMGAYMDATAVAVGFSKAFNDGHTVVKLSGTYDSQQRAGASAGVGYQF